MSALDTITKTMYVPIEGDVVTMKVDDAVTSFKAGCVLYYTGNLTVAPTTGTIRGPVAGIAATDFPEPSDTNVRNYGDPNVYDRSMNTYATLGARKRRIGVIMNQVCWALVHIPASGSNITITVGQKLVPCSQATSSGVQPYVRTNLNATFSDTEVEAEFDEIQRIVGVALSNIHTAYQNTGQPALNQNAADTLVATASIVYGWVLARIGVLV